ncbi:MAG: SLATT domain-containing protein [Nitrospirota bacterium]
MTEQFSTEEKVISIAKDEIIKEAKRIEENSLYSAKGHFVAAHFWDNFHLWIGIPTVVLAAVAGTAAFAKIDQNNFIAGALSIVVVVLTAVATFLNPKERSHTHLTSGNNYDSLLTRARMFWTIECRRENLEDALSAKLNSLSDERDRLNRESPQVPKWAFKKARKGIEEGEASYKVDGKVES